LVGFVNWFPDILKKVCHNSTRQSASGCIASNIPDSWTIEWTQDTLKSRMKEAKTFNLNERRNDYVITGLALDIGQINLLILEYVGIGVSP